VPPTNGWSTQQLTEFLAALGAARSRAAALRLATERIAESLEAEVAAVIINRRVAAQVGFPRCGLPRGLARRLVTGAETIDIPGMGVCGTLVCRLEEDRDAWLTIARAGDQGFSAEDRALMRGMARILALTLHNLGLLARERAARLASQRQAAEIRERQRMLEALAAVQRMIVARAPQQEILDRLVADVGRFVGDPIVGLRLIAPDGDLHLVAAMGLDSTTFGALEHSAVGVGAGGMAMAEDRLVVIADYTHHPAALAALSERGLQTAAAAPIHQDGRPIGSLVVASNTPGRRYESTQLEALAAFAEHASLALTDSARTAQILHLALHDALTGLPNRTLFSDRLNQRLLAGRRHREQAAVLFIDIDNLKRVNDTLGHPAGDAVLIEVGRRLRATVGDADTVARLSGDEFTVLLDSVDGEADAMATAHRLVDALRRPLEVADRSLTLTASVGVRLCRAGRDRASDALRGADLAMYDAKKRTDRFVALFHPELDSRAARRLELESDLRAALDAGAFRVFYQPIVGLRDRSLRAVEALVRWDRGPLGLVSPAEFIPLAEETGLIVELGAWVLEEACRTVAALDRSSAVPLRLSVNLSARQLVEPGLEAIVVQALAASGLAADRLTLEITESVLLTDTIATVTRLDALRRLGVKVAIDDFGTGYSSLGYLRRLPLDSVKIDRTFIEHLTDDLRQAALVRAIVELCRSLELEIVAEGVESEPQARRLLDLGCELGQGYHLGRPMPASALVNSVRRTEASAARAASAGAKEKRAIGRAPLELVAPVA
jgi:diguanylate cyclase (GGDEF)-like protein